MVDSNLAPHSADNVVQIARSWLGTPYHHQASCRGVGADCLGLVRGVLRELYGNDAEVPPAYSRDWAEASQTETMLDAAKRHLASVEVDNINAGDVVIFRYRRRTLAKHAGIMTDHSHFIHAMEGGPVSEVALTHWWRRRIAAAFSFPGIKR